MPLWLNVVGLVQATLFAIAHLFGGSVGAAIVVLSLAVRLALLPLTYRVAVRARELQAQLKCVQPELDRLRARHASDPARLLAETRALHRRHGIPLVPRGTLPSALVQLPVGAALYRAIASLGRAGRFLWIGDLARPDVVVAATAAALTSATVLASSPNPSASRTAAVVSGLVTLLVAWRIGAGVGLYWAASSAIGALEGLLVGRRRRSA